MMLAIVFVETIIIFVLMLALRILRREHSGNLVAWDKTAETRNKLRDENSQLRSEVAKYKQWIENAEMALKGER